MGGDRVREMWDDREREGRHTRGSEIDILGLYGGAHAGLLLGWLGGCRLPCLLLGFFKYFGLKMPRRHTPGPRCTWSPACKKFCIY